MTGRTNTNILAIFSPIISRILLTNFLLVILQTSAHVIKYYIYKIFHLYIKKSALFIVGHLSHCWLLTFINHTGINPWVHKYWAETLTIYSASISNYENGLFLLFLFNIKTPPPPPPCNLFFISFLNHQVKLFPDPRFREPKGKSSGLGIRKSRFTSH